MVKLWWDLIIKYGPYIGYEVNERKSKLIVKEAYYDQAKLLFSNSQIHITTSGNRHLGAVIGDEDCTTKYVDKEGAIVDKSTGNL